MPTVYLSADASGAAGAASHGLVVMIVDVIDMSTTCEAVLEEGALYVFGAAPDDARPPVTVDPAFIGQLAGKMARCRKANLVIVAGPRWGNRRQRIARVQKVIRGIRQCGMSVEKILPNLGAETGKLACFQRRVVVVATSAGGAAFNAAFCAGAPAVLTGTVARTRKKNGSANALAAVQRALLVTRKLGKDLAVVAASANSLEDLLAAEFIFRLALKKLRTLSP
ncbi:MAG: hypothetical protein ACUVSK_05425 [Desulfotomaculales bacterium]